MTQIRLRAPFLAASARLPSARDALTFAELSAQLAAARPGTAIVEGDLAGRIIAIVGIERLPFAVRAPITWVVSVLARPLWRGKRFHTTCGTNVWLSRRYPHAFAHFSHTIDMNGHAALHYEQPLLIRRISGELAKLGPGFFLGAMYLNIGRRRVTLAYFTLEH